MPEPDPYHKITWAFIAALATLVLIFSSRLYLNMKSTDDLQNERLQILYEQIHATQQELAVTNEQQKAIKLRLDRLEK